MSADIEFQNKQIIKPLTRPKPDLYIREKYSFSNSIQVPFHNPSLEKDTMEINSNIKQPYRWAVGTIKKSAEECLAPKIEKYKNYNFIPREKIYNENVEKPVTYLSTDHISIKPREGPKNSKTGFFEMKSKSYIYFLLWMYLDIYGSHFESKNSSWIPVEGVKTINNKSGVAYNIISHDDNNPSGYIKQRMFDKKMANRKKGLCEFDDITNPFSSNLNKEFNKSLDKHPNMFKRYKGIFSNMYDAAHRNGNLVVPFRREKSLEKKQNNPK